MTSEYYITLLSNNSINFYKNTLSSFTNQLNPPLELDSLGKWKVGITDIYHSFVLDNPYDSRKDCIKFDKNLRDHGSYNMTKITFYMMVFAKDPRIYSTSYFHDFLNKENLKDFPNSEIFADLKLKQMEHQNKDTQITIHLESKQHEINNENIFDFSVKLDISKIYTAKEILFCLMNGYNKAFEKLLKDDVNKREKRADMLYGYIDLFVDNIHNFQSLLIKEKDFTNNVDSGFMMIYVDCISPRNFGDGYLNVLQMIPLREVLHEYTAIRNIQYFPVNKTLLTDISIKIADEYGNPIPFENSYSPTVVTLHFKKDL